MDSDLPDLKDIKVMGYSLRTWDYRYTLWLGFNPKTFQVSVSHYIFMFFSECIKLGSIHLVWHNMLENVFHDSNRLYKSIIHLSLHLGECIRRSRWRVVHVGRRPWSGQEHLQRLRPQCDDEKDGQPASCEFKKRKKSSNQFSINLFTCFFSDSRSPSRLWVCRRGWICSSSTSQQGWRRAEQRRDDENKTQQMDGRTESTTKGRWMDEELHLEREKCLEYFFQYDAYLILYYVVSL